MARPTTSSLSLANKVAIITGSGKPSGIGAAIALTLAKAGARVVINCISDSTWQLAQDVVKNVEAVAGSGSAVAVQADIGSLEGAAKLVEEGLAKLGTDKVDIIGKVEPFRDIHVMKIMPADNGSRTVNNAAWSKPGPTVHFAPEVLHKCFAVMVFGPLYLLRAALPHMGQGGRVINIGSVASKLGLPGAGLYGAAKAAMDALTYSLALELGRNGAGITVNTVMPGPVPTEGVPAHPDVQKGHERLKTMTRAEDRLGRAEDIADSVLLLASEQSRWITGQVISVSGGITGG